MKIHKFVVVGASGSGKTCLIQRHIHGLFLRESRPSASVDFSLVAVDDETQVHVWDVPGSESATGRTPIWYEGASVVFVVADVSRSMNLAADWLLDVRKRLNVPIILLLNKKDLGGAGSKREAIDNFCKSEGVTAFFECSALEGVGFAEAMRFAITQLKK